MSEIKYKRILLKISGEALAGEMHRGLDFDVVHEVCRMIRDIADLGVQLGVVIASSMASEMAVPSEPWWLGYLVRMFLPARVDMEGEGVTCAPNVCMMLRR